MPELGFDALWYHLTLPKLYLQKHQWYFPGGLLYYSAMPRLMETLFIPLIHFTGSIGPKFVQFAAGLISCLSIYKILKQLTSDKLLPLIGVNLFYATWLVSWQSSSAYIDLCRTMFEVTALMFLIQKRSVMSLIGGGLLLGLAIGTKWHALVSLLIFSLVFSPALLGIGLLVSLPWFLIAFHFTNNPFYPLFEPFMMASQFSQTRFSIPFILPFDDFFSPAMGLVFLMSLPALFSRRKIVRQVTLVGILGSIIASLTPPPSSRYFLPYLPSVIISCTYIISKLLPRYQKIMIILFTASSIFILFLLLLSLAKFIPILLGQSHNHYLASISSRLPDTFIDSDNFVTENLPSDSKILIDKLHNLYYFPFNYDHTSWAKPGVKYDYLITVGDPVGQKDKQLLHTNSLGIQVFKLY